MVCRVVVCRAGESTSEERIICLLFSFSPFKEAVGPRDIPNVSCPALCHKQDFVKKMKYLWAGLVDCADDGSPLACQSPHHLHHACSHHRVKPARGFVTEQESRVGQDLGGKSQPLHLASRNPFELARNPNLCVAALWKPQLLDYFLHSFHSLFFRHISVHPQQGLEDKVLSYGEASWEKLITIIKVRCLTKEEIVLLHISGDCKKATRRDRLSVGHPLSRHLKTGEVSEEQRVHQGRLARTAGAQYCKELPWANHPTGWTWEWGENWFFFHHCWGFALALNPIPGQEEDHSIVGSGAKPLLLILIKNAFFFDIPSLIDLTTRRWQLDWQGVYFGSGGDQWSLLT